MQPRAVGGFMAGGPWPLQQQQMGGYGPAGVRPQQRTAPYTVPATFGGIRPQLAAKPTLPFQQGVRPQNQGIRPMSSPVAARQAASNLAALVKEFTHAAADLGKTDQELEKLFAQVQAARGMGRTQVGGVAAAAALPAITNGAPTDPKKAEAEAAKRKDQLLRAVSARLQMNGGTEALNGVTTDPKVATLRKGTVSNMAKFLRDFPQFFEIDMAANPVEGKGEIQIVRLLKPVPMGFSAANNARATVPEAERREALIQSLADVLAEAGGSALMTEIGINTRVRAAGAGISVKLSKFISQYPEVFQLDGEEGGPARASLLVDATSAVPMADVRSKLEAAAAACAPKQAVGLA